MKKYYLLIGGLALILITSTLTAKIQHDGFIYYDDTENVIQYELVKGKWVTVYAFPSTGPNSFYQKWKSAVEGKLADPVTTQEAKIPEDIETLKHHIGIQDRTISHPRRSQRAKDRAQRQREQNQNSKPYP